MMPLLGRLQGVCRSQSLGKKGRNLRRTLMTMMRRKKTRKDRVLICPIIHPGGFNIEEEKPLASNLDSTNYFTETRTARWHPTKDQHS
jgi:hypothetical protein